MVNVILQIIWRIESAQKQCSELRTLLTASAEKLCEGLNLYAEYSLLRSNVNMRELMKVMLEEATELAF